MFSLDFSLVPPCLGAVALCFLAVGCGRRPAQPASEGVAAATATTQSSPPTASASSSPVVGGETFSFNDDDLTVKIDLPPQSTCIGFSVSSMPGTRCENPPGARTDELRRSGTLLLLISKGSSGPLLFTASVNEKLRAVTRPDAFVQGIIDQAKSQHGFTLAENSQKSGTALLSASTVVHKFIFDADVTRDSPPNQLAFSHWAVLAIPGQRGLYSLTWITNLTRADEADRSAEKALGSIRRSDARH